MRQDTFRGFSEPQGPRGYTRIQDSYQGMSGNHQESGVIEGDRSTHSEDVREPPGVRGWAAGGMSINSRGVRGPEGFRIHSENCQGAI
jgi:hypothetical protein